MQHGLEPTEPGLSRPVQSSGRLCCYCCCTPDTNSQPSIDHAQLLVHYLRSTAARHSLPHTHCAAARQHTSSALVPNSYRQTSSLFLVFVSFCFWHTRTTQHAPFTSRSGLLYLQLWEMIRQSRGVSIGVTTYCFCVAGKWHHLCCFHTINSLVSSPLTRHTTGCFQSRVLEWLKTWAITYWRQSKMPKHFY